MYQLRLHHLLTAILCLTICACGPIYDTRYTFIPPESQLGRNCTFHCETNRQSCRQLEQIRYENCQERSRNEQDRCEWENERRGEKTKWYDCLGDSCSDESERCEEQYRSCYQSCGGEVQAVTECVANCDQAKK